MDVQGRMVLTHKWPTSDPQVTHVKSRVFFLDLALKLVISKSLLWSQVAVATPWLDSRPLHPEGYFRIAWDPWHSTRHGTPAGMDKTPRAWPLPCGEKNCRWMGIDRHTKEDQADRCTVNCYVFVRKEGQEHDITMDRMKDRHWRDPTDIDICTQTMQLDDRLREVKKCNT